MSVSQNAPPSPDRSPANPVVGSGGTFGIAYDTYNANGSAGFNITAPDDGLGIGRKVHLNGGTANSYVAESAPENVTDANNFAASMQKNGWSQSFLLRNDQFFIDQLKGSGTIFNSANFGMLITHGDKGTTSDSTGGGLYNGIYFPITSFTDGEYLRFTDMNLGGAGTSGLKWMCMNSCNSLAQNNWNSMLDQHHNPINSNLHLILGANSETYSSEKLATIFPTYMLTTAPTIGTNGLPTNGPPLTIRLAWYQAGSDAYHNSGFNYGITMEFAVAGSAACSGDFLQTTNLTTPTASPYYDHHQVYP